MLLRSGGGVGQYYEVRKWVETELCDVPVVLQCLFFYRVVKQMDGKAKGRGVKDGGM